MSLLVRELDIRFATNPDGLEELLASGVPAPCSSINQIPRRRFGPDASQRVELATSLESSIAPLQPPAAVLRSIQDLKGPECSIVLSTARTSFLGAPLQNLYRAIHAVALARSLATAWSTPVVPVIWNDCDSPLQAEAHSSWLLNENFELERISMPVFAEGTAPGARDDLGLLEGALAEVRDLTASRFGDLPFMGRALDLLLPQARGSLSRSFTRWLLALLGNQGLVVIEPDWDRETYARGLAMVSNAASRRAARDERGREGSSACHQDESESLSLSDLVLVQESILPVACIIGTWDDYKVHITSTSRREGLGLVAPAFALALRGVLVDPRTRRALKRCSMDVPEVLSQGRASSAGVRVNQAASAAARIRSIAEAASSDLRACREELLELEPGLAALLRRTAAQVRAHIDQLAGKVERAGANRAARTRSAERLATNMLLPLGRPQDEVLGPLSFLAAAGDAWPGNLVDRVKALPVAPVLVELEEL